MQECDFICSQPIKGVPVLMFAYGTYKVYVPFAAPTEYKRVSDNVSYAIYSGPSAKGKLTVTTEGTGDTRTNPIVTFEEVTNDT